jgi:UDP-glucose-4-epimerase GalE
MKILVTGGAGYIGSHTVRLLREQGEDVHIVDNLATGHAEAVAGLPLHVLDLRDKPAVDRLLAELRPEAAIHFAAHCYVGESVTQPRKYFEDNLGAALNLLGAMIDCGCRLFVLSSTCATYGEPRTVPIPENHPQAPINPYGESKLFIERILHRYDEAYGLRSACLRYFNAAGADASSEIGESHAPETHLIPLMIRAILDPAYTLTVFGDDYPTPDGTCLRDYIHVSDLAEAHARSLTHLLRTDRSVAFNLGTGTGYSVLQMIHCLEALTGRTVKRRIGPRREGDPPVLVASAVKAAGEMGWHCRHSEIDTILATAWNWHCQPRF